MVRKSVSRRRLKSQADVAAATWRRRADALARRIPLSDLHERAVSTISALPSSQRMAIACSGGADSTALLLLLWAHFPARRGRWLILHFDHGIRGADSTADAAFVRTIARSLGEKCIVRRWRRQQPALATVSETVARKARWSFFESALKTSKRALIATGHQADDVAESMLMRLARGAGTSGLASPRPVQRMENGATRVRPLLTLASRRIREALRDAGITWREDRTNFSDAHFRNRIRQRVLPELADASPQELLAGTARSRALIEEDSHALDTIVEGLIAPYRRRRNWDLTSIRIQPAAIVRRVALRWLAARKLSTNLSRNAVEHLIRAVVAGEDLRMSAGRDIEIILGNSCLAVKKRLRPKTRLAFPIQTLKTGTSKALPSGGRISARRRPLTTSLRKRILAGEFRPDKTVFLSVSRTGASDCFTVRQWRPGDRYRPLGAPGRSKLQDMFVNRKISPEQRILLPVICMAGRGVVWVPGIPPAQELAIQPQTKLVVQLTYFPPGPMVNGSKQP